MLHASLPKRPQLLQTIKSKATQRNPKMSITTTNPPKRLRILLLHGYTQSGPLFHAKTRALEKSLRKAFPSPSYTLSLEYPTAPIPIKPADLPVFTSASPPGQTNRDSDTSPHSATADDDLVAYGWWKRKDKEGGEVPLGTGERAGGYVYEGMDRALLLVSQYLKGEKGAAGGDDGINRLSDGGGVSSVNGSSTGSGDVDVDAEALSGFDGVIGFSQGGCFAGMLASLLENGRLAAFEKAAATNGGMRYPASFLAEDSKGVEGADPGVAHPPLKFAVVYSGFAPAPNALYDAFYEPPISTPVLHVLGSNDTVVEESRSMRLVDSCVDGRKRIVWHPGGHFLPSGKMQMAALVDFIRESMGWKESQGKDDSDDLPL